MMKLIYYTYWIIVISSIFFIINYLITNKPVKKNIKPRIVTDEKTKKYLKQLEMNYDELVEHLLSKYGAAKEDYFIEKSYNRLLNDEIKSLSVKTGVTRTDEGLYCHHIDENKYANMTKRNYIKNQNIPFEAQKRGRLVYCDLIEHAILHTLITYETKSEYGKKGLMEFLIPNIEDWYILDIKPNQEWRVNCYNKSYLEKEEVLVILDKIKSVID